MGSEEIWEKLNILYSESRRIDMQCSGCGVFEWEIGDMIANILIADSIITCWSDEIKEIMGIPVRINFQKKDCIKLWSEVKDNRNPESGL